MYAKIYFYTNKNKKIIKKNTKIFSFSDITSFTFIIKQRSHFSLNKSTHVYKKAKEHFVFFWPHRGMYITPFFLDEVSYQLFLSNFVKFFSVLYPSHSFFIKKIRYM